MRTVIVTGGIGSGKSALCAYLASKGYPVYDSDARTKQLYALRPQILDTLSSLWGESLWKAEGEPDFPRIASRVFGHPERLRQLEDLVYPAVLEDFRRWKSEVPPQTPFVVLESAVILSKPAFDGIGDRIILVVAPEALRLQRVLLRDASTPEAVRRRMRAQVPVAPSRADVILLNDGSLEEFFRKADEVIAHLFDE